MYLPFITFDSTCNATGFLRMLLENLDIFLKIKFPIEENNGPFTKSISFLDNYNTSIDQSSIRAVGLVKKSFLSKFEWRFI